MRKLRAAAVALATIAAVMTFTATAGAVTTGAQLDQSSTATGNDMEGFISWLHNAVASQTFTAGVSGQLTDVTATIDAELSSNQGDLRAAINPTDGSGNPNTGVELAVATLVPTSTLPTFTPTSVDFVFGTPATLVAGTKYAITITEVSTFHQHFYWSGSNGDTYAGGDSSDTIIGGAGDYIFGTYMIPTPVVGGGRAGYCVGGVFENLAYGQPGTDPVYAKATPAIFVKGEGLTCDSPPAGWTQQGFAGVDLDVPWNTYSFYAPPS